MARELTIEVRAETQQAEQGLQKVEDRLHGVEQAAEKTGDKIDDFGDSADDAARKTGPLANVLAKLGGPAGVATMAGTAMLFATKYSIDFASGIAKAARAADVTTDAMQGLDAVARKNGSTFDVLSKAMFDLDVRLVKGSKNVTAAVGAIGLELDDLLSMSRDQRFRAVAEALVGIEDPAERARLAVELLGGEAQDLMPIMKDLADGADKEMPRLSRAFVEAGDQIAQAWTSVMQTLMSRGSQFLAYLTLWPAALANWSTSVSEAMWGVMGQLPSLPGAPSSPLLAPPSTTFDPLQGNSMAFWERTLTQGAQASIRAATGGGGAARVLPFVRPSLMGESQGYNVLQAQMYNGVGFPGMTGGFGGLGFPGWSGPAPLAARQNLNFAPYAGSVPMDAPGARGGGFGSMLSGLFKSSYGSGFGGFLSGAGGGIAAGLGSLFTKGADKAQGIGSMIGGIAGGFLGPLGSIAGSFLGGKLGGLFGGGEGKTTNRTRDAWIGENFGSVDKLREAAAEAGFSLDRMLSTKKVKDFESEVKKLQAAMGESEQDAQRVGEAMDRWGISIDEMGPKFKQTKINDAFKEALDDIRVLTNAGADFNVIAEKMAPTLGGMVHEAIEMGGTVPREMEPVLKKMIELGLLTDKNGDKFTDLSQIPFAADLNKDFTTLIGKMDALISRLAGIPSLFGEATDAATEFANATPDGSGLPTRPETGEAGMDGGGTVGRTWRQRSMRDTVPMWLRPGEVVLTPEQARGGMSVSIGSVSVGGGASRAQTAESVGEAVVAYMERRGVRFGRRVA